jgi:hypothetical protein
MSPETSTFAKSHSAFRMWLHIQCAFPFEELDTYANAETYIFANQEMLRITERLKNLRLEITQDVYDWEEDGE